MGKPDFTVSTAHTDIYHERTNEMKLNKNFLVHKTGNDTIIVPTGDADFSGIVKGNKTLGAILDFLKKDTTEEYIIEEMAKIYDAPHETIENDVKKSIASLKGIGAIDE